LEEKQLLWTDMYDKYGIPIQCAESDVAVACNMRFAHGRKLALLNDGKKRELGVKLGSLSFEREETMDGRQQIMRDEASNNNSRS
jgi:hypothetical protein